MKIVLWDTQRNDVQKDFAGGMGVGMHPGTGGWRGKLVRYMYKRDNRPVALNFAYLSAILKQLGHWVQYVVDETPDADLYIFNPALMTLEIEKEVIRNIKRRSPATRVFVVGQVAFAMAQEFAGTGAVVLRGEPEQLLYKLDQILSSPQHVINIGSVSDLNDLPFPDWSAFRYSRFRIKYDFWRFPSTFIQQSRGCTFKCNYCPYILAENKTRFRDADSVVAEMRHGIEKYGFESFKFRDPLFGLNRKNALALADGIRGLPKKIQFSIETRVDLMKLETLTELRKSGLTSITIGIETPDENTLRRYSRVAIDDDRQREFVVRCRDMGIRTVAGFMVGFPDDTSQSILDVLNYARVVNPTFANFNIVTPYPGTGFYQEVKDRIGSHDYSKYSVYQPVMQYTNLTMGQVAELHGRCFSKFYFRSRYFKDNARLLWPGINRWLPESKDRTSLTTDSAGRSIGESGKRKPGKPVLPVTASSNAGEAPDSRAA